MAASAAFALKPGVWFRRGRLLIVSPDSLGTACPLSGRNSTYRPVQILEASSLMRSGERSSTRFYIVAAMRRLRTLSERSSTRFYTIDDLSHDCPDPSSLDTTQEMGRN